MARNLGEPARTSARAVATLAALIGLVVALLVVSPSPARADQGGGDGEQVTVSQSEPDPSLGPVTARVRGDRKAQGKCASRYRWLGLCTYAGYALPKCKRSWCGLMGTLISSGTKAYRTDLGASSKPRGYGAASPVVNSGKRRGRCSWTTRQGHQAAYILSAFGAVGANNREAAAVDAALSHKLCGKKWRLGGRATGKRLAMTGISGATSKAVKRRARVILKQAKNQAGPYALKVITTPAAPGQPVTVRAKIATSTGTGAVNRLVRLTVPGAYGTVDAYTNGAGEATWTFPMSSGLVTGTVTAPALEDYQLHVRQPKAKRSARVLLAGQTYEMSQVATLTARQQPTLSISVAEARVPGGIPANFTYGSSLGSERKTATAVLYGPFGSATGSSCLSGAIATTTREVSGNGLVDISGWAPATSGYYRISVAVDGDASNEPVAGCSNPLYIYPAQPGISAVFPGNDTQNQSAGWVFTSYFDYVGGYGAGARYWHATLWGPFDSKSQSSCDAGAAKMRKQFDGYVTGDGRYNIASDSVGASNAGWYRWGITVNGDGSNDPTSACAGAFQILTFSG